MRSGAVLVQVLLVLLVCAPGCVGKCTCSAVVVACEYETSPSLHRFLTCGLSCLSCLSSMPPPPSLYSYWDLAGKRVPVVTTEQGIGRGRPRVTQAMNWGFHGAGGNWHTTYTAIPHYMTSEMRSLFLDDYHVAYFDFVHSGVVEVEIVHPFVGTGPAPATGAPAATGVRVPAAAGVPDAANAASANAATPSTTPTSSTSFASSASVSSLSVSPASGEAAMEVTGRILHGDTPLALVEAFTAWSGRMKPLPRWASGQGAVVGMEGGTATVRALWSRLQEAGVPLGGLWLQDWTGVRNSTLGERLWWNWEVDYDRYPGWDQLVEDMRGNGTRMLVYLNPFLSNSVHLKPNARRNLWAEAGKLGYLMKNNSGDPYIQHSGAQNFSFSAIDLTNPAAMEWTKGVIRCNVLRIGPGCGANFTSNGTSGGNNSNYGDGANGTGGNGTGSLAAMGWMSDFAEYTPFDSVLHSGNAASVHNQYPGLWAKSNRDAVDEAGFGGDAVFFSRSASLTSPSYSSLFWMGDQLVTYGADDGLQSGLVGMMNGGLSGHSLSHTDTGGYTMLHECVNVAGHPLICLDYHRDQQLLQRWMETTAFSDAMFRTHPGNLPGQSAQVYSNAVLLQSCASFAKVHALLYPYRALLMADAALTGAPLTRHPWIHYPHDPVLGITTTQFMMGRHVMVVPALRANVTSVHAYLPRWASGGATPGGASEAGRGVAETGRAEERGMLPPSSSSAAAAAGGAVVSTGEETRSSFTECPGGVRRCWVHWLTHEAYTGVNGSDPTQQGVFYEVDTPVGRPAVFVDSWLMPTGGRESGEGEEGLGGTSCTVGSAALCSCSELISRHLIKEFNDCTQEAAIQACSDGSCKHQDLIGSERGSVGGEDQETMRRMWGDVRRVMMGGR